MRFRTYEIPTTVQQESWLRSLRAGGAGKNVPVLFTVAGPVDTDRLSAAVDDVVARHVMLRTSFDPDRPDRAIVHRRRPLDLRVLDAPTETFETARDFAVRPFELGDEQRMRCGVCPLPDGSTLVLLVVDRLSCDGLSGSILASDAFGYLENSTATENTKPDISYARFAREQRTWLTSDAAASARRFWAAEFDRWGSDRPRCVLGRDSTASSGGDTKRLTHRLPEPAVVAVDVLVGRHHTSRLVVLAAAILRQLISDFGEPSAGLTIDFHGRTKPWVHGTVGMFTHSMDLHLARDEAADIDHAIVAVRDRMARRVEQALPRSVVARDHPEAQVTGSARPTLYLSTSPFDLRMPGSGAALLTLPFDPRQYTDAVPHRLDIEIGTAGGGLELKANMRVDHFHVEEVSRLLEHITDRLVREHTFPGLTTFSR
ncbi:condensation domain-containing protein [Nocardia sp. Marseille-Q1738]